MATARFCVLFIILAVALAEDAEVKHKTAPKPVRLITEDELQRYDGSEVNCWRNKIPACAAENELACLLVRAFFFLLRVIYIYHRSFFSYYRRASLFIWQ